VILGDLPRRALAEGQHRIDGSAIEPLLAPSARPEARQHGPAAGPRSVAASRTRLASERTPGALQNHGASSG